MKIHLTYYDVLEILAERFNLETYDASASAMKKEISLMHDELYWEGNEEQKKSKGAQNERN